MWCVEVDSPVPLPCCTVPLSALQWGSGKQLQLSFFLSAQALLGTLAGSIESFLWTVVQFGCFRTSIGQWGRSLPPVTAFNAFNAFNGLRAWLCAALPARRVPVLTRQSNCPGLGHWNRSSLSHSIHRPGFRNLQSSTLHFTAPTLCQLIVSAPSHHHHPLRPNNFLNQ